MFSRKSCYFFVRPKKNFLEVCVFLGRALKAPQVRRVDRASKSKVAHLMQIRHRDEVEAPVTDWLQEAYELSDVLASKAGTRRAKSKPKAGPKKKRRRSRKISGGRRFERRSADGGRRTNSYAFLACSENAAPCGSIAFTIQSPPGTSIGPLRIWPPLALTRSTAALMSSTRK